MRKRVGFVSNSSSCSFLVVQDISPAKTDKRLREIIKFHKEMTGESNSFSYYFNPSFIAEGEFAEKYEKAILEHDYSDCRKELLKSLGGMVGRTIIHPKVEDNEIPFLSLIETYAHSIYERHNDEIGELLR